MSKKYNNIIITGGLGHIGAQLIRDLDPRLTDNITIIDNLESQRFPSLYNLPKKFSYRFIKDDILTFDFKKYLKNGKESAVIHLAAVTDAERSFSRQEEIESINYGGLKRVADACLEKGVRLFFPSTTSVYGSQAKLVDETCRELKPQSPYAESKIHSEDYLRSLGRKGLKFIICRFGTIYGHSIGMRYDTAVNKFTWQAVNALPITVYKTAWNQKRPYLYLKDCTSAVNFILRRDLFDGEVYNVLTENLTVKDVARTIKSFIPSLKITYVMAPIMNQLSYEVDDTKFRSLGFKPIGSSKSGIAETVARLSGIIKRKK